MLRETTSRGLCGLVCPSRTSERGGEGDCVKEGGEGEGKLRLQSTHAGAPVRYRIPAFSYAKAQRYSMQWASTCVRTTSRSTPGTSWRSVFGLALVSSAPMHARCFAYEHTRMRMCRFTLHVLATCRASRICKKGVIAFRTCMAHIIHAPADAS